ncbi:MAG: hypothetical protein A2X94_05370 [Bdellovibrionales bacterium GWB1_55_8]|nr:MAG: hypothetical protein A2X94_05370 [Bdellovibrionales bacterium GWB1_55_8]
MSSSGSKLGRNPFQKGKAASEALSPVSVPSSALYREPVDEVMKEDPRPISEIAQETGSVIAKFALVDVPAAAVVLGLKCILLATDVFSSKRK